MIKIITDSSADLPSEVIEKYNIKVVPLTVTIEGRDYLEGKDITPAEFFSEMGSDIEVLCMTISSGLSGTYQSACLAKEMSHENVTVFDTLAGSLGHGLQINRAAELIEQGYTMDKVIAELTEYRDNMNILVLLNTLEILSKVAVKQISRVTCQSIKHKSDFGKNRRWKSRYTG